MMMRHLYQECRLVHGDLSEYNLLYFKEKVYMIDVSQSVEHDHPMALDFLRRDCSVMNDFFQKINCFVLTSIKLFNFITDISLTEGIEQGKEDEVLTAKLGELLTEAQVGYSEE